MLPAFEAAFPFLHVGLFDLFVYHSKVSNLLIPEVFIIQLLVLFFRRTRHCI
jgi:hypothetical protein